MTRRVVHPKISLAVNRRRSRGAATGSNRSPTTRGCRPGQTRGRRNVSRPRRRTRAPRTRRPRRLTPAPPARRQPRTRRLRRRARAPPRPRPPNRTRSTGVRTRVTGSGRSPSSRAKRSASARISSGRLFPSSTPTTTRTRRPGSARSACGSGTPSRPPTINPASRLSATSRWRRSPGRRTSSCRAATERERSERRRPCSIRIGGAGAPSARRTRKATSRARRCVYVIAIQLADDSMPLEHRKTNASFMIKAHNGALVAGLAASFLSARNLTAGPH